MTMWSVKISDPETDFDVVGFIDADSEIEAKIKIKASLDRLFMGQVEVQYSSLPEEFAPLLNMLRHGLSQAADDNPHNYRFGGPDDPL